jgi:hypothetical protein
MHTLRKVALPVLALALIAIYLLVAQQARVQARSRVDAIRAELAPYVDVTYSDIGLSIPWSRTISIRDLSIRQAGGGPTAVIDTVNISGFSDEQDVSQHRTVQIEGLSFPLAFLAEIVPGGAISEIATLGDPIIGNYEAEWDLTGNELEIGVSASVNNLFDGEVAVSLGNLDLGPGDKASWAAKLDKLAGLRNLVLKNGHIRFTDQSLLDRVFRAVARNRGIDFGFDRLITLDRHIASTENPRLLSLLVALQDLVLAGGTVAVNAAPNPAMPVVTFVRLAESDRFAELTDQLKFPIFYYATRSITMPIRGFRVALSAAWQSIPKPCPPRSLASERRRSPKAYSVRLFVA